MTDQEIEKIASVCEAMTHTAKHIQDISNLIKQGNKRQYFITSEHQDPVIIYHDQVLPVLELMQKMSKDHLQVLRNEWDAWLKSSKQ